MPLNPWKYKGKSRAFVLSKFNLKRRKTDKKTMHYALLPLLHFGLVLLLAVSPGYAQEKICAENFAQVAKADFYFTYKDHISALVHLKSGGSSKMLAPSMRKDLYRLAGVKGEKELLANLDDAFSSLYKLMGKENFEKEVGQNLSTIKIALQKEADKIHGPSHSLEDTIDFRRGWGWRLLPENDPAFNDPAFLARLLTRSGATGNVMDLGYHGRDAFDKAWRKLAPKNVPAPTHFTLTGSDANNTFYDIAESTLKQKRNTALSITEYFPRELGRIEAEIKKAENTIEQIIQMQRHPTAEWQSSEAQQKLRQYLKEWEPHLIKLQKQEKEKIEAIERAKVFLAKAQKQEKPASILVFEGSYGAGSGKLKEFGYLNQRGQKNTPEMITSPVSNTLNPTDPKEIARLKELETKALKEIREKADQLNAGGILIEPIQGINGVKFYRTEFLLALRKLCDELQIPIFADEVLTGGGRTGKFFGYEHHAGFEPDFISFGKGLQLAGIAKVERGKDFTMPMRMVTLHQYDEAILKSTQIMNRIHDDKLMENATRSGQYMVERLRQRAKQTDDSQIRGIGALIYDGAGAADYRIRGAMRRLLPPMTITEKEVDELLPMIP